MKYKIGDRVRIKGFDWYYSNSDCMGNVECGDFYFTTSHTNYCGKTLEILSVCDDYYLMKDVSHRWTDEMIEGLADVETQDKMVSLDKVCNMLYAMLETKDINDYDYVTAPAYDTVEDLVEDFRKSMEG
jgi:hypothetical protein